jgi:hypothetical protein
MTTATSMPLIGQDVERLSLSVFQSNVIAGWWTCIKTGESLVGKRNVGELLMLCVSEVCEGGDGLAMNLMDDKLPHRQMIEVELADFAIRTFDLAGGLSIAADLGQQFDRIAADRLLGATFGILHTPTDYLFRIIRFTSEAMEHHRKGRITEMAEPLAYALHGCLILGEIMDLEVMEAVAEKREFNKTRADHQVESRMAAGGKAY